MKLNTVVMKIWANSYKRLFYNQITHTEAVVHEQSLQKKILRHGITIATKNLFPLALYMN